MTEAYTYLLRHKLSGKVYYGSRKATEPEKDLFLVYFSSSRLVQRLIAVEGQRAFEYEIRRKFESYAAARCWETKVLRRLKVIQSKRWLNQAISAPRLCLKDSDAEKQRRQKIAQRMKEVWLDANYRRKQTDLSLEQRKRRSETGRLGAKKRGRIYTKGPRRKRPSRPTSFYKLIEIEREGKQKQIHQNQLSAYRKLGWNRAVSSGSGGIL